jgi:predicted 3-demethylubiquinone-9 3-methyltransferase (glyoxalase superfamily)
MQKITPFLWLDNNAEEAMQFYTSVFKNARVINTRHYEDSRSGSKGSVMTATIELEGQEFMLLNAGPMFKFTEAISFFVKCRDQQEVDYYWEKLCEGGQTSQCGWLKDKFGLSWQIIPDALGEYLGDKDPKKANNVMMAMLKMSKIEVAKLKEAYEQA